MSSQRSPPPLAVQLQVTWPGVDVIFELEAPQIRFGKLTSHCCVHDGEPSVTPPQMDGRSKDPAVPVLRCYGDCRTASSCCISRGVGGYRACLVDPRERGCANYHRCGTYHGDNDVCRPDRVFEVPELSIVVME